MAHMPALESLRIGVSDARGHLVEDAGGLQYAGPDLVHGPNVRLIDTGHGLHVLELHEQGTSSRWRFRPERGKPWGAKEVTLMTKRTDGRQQTFTFAEQNGFIESHENVPEPHSFSIHLNLGHGDHSHGFEFTYGAGEDPSQPIKRLH
jgi:nickel/cobalt exporter